jgi:hypothetical protein
MSKTRFVNELSKDDITVLQKRTGMGIKISLYFLIIFILLGFADPRQGGDSWT